MTNIAPPAFTMPAGYEPYIRPSKDDGTIRLSDDLKPFTVGDWVTNRFADEVEARGQVVDMGVEHITVDWNHGAQHSRSGVELQAVTEPWKKLLHISAPTTYQRGGRVHGNNNITAWLLDAAARRSAWTVSGRRASEPWNGTSGYHGHASASGRGYHRLTRIDVWFDHTGAITTARVMGEKSLGRPYVVVVDEHPADAGHAAMMWLIP